MIGPAATHRLLPAGSGAIAGAVPGCGGSRPSLCRSLVERSRELLVVVRPDRSVMFASRAAERLLGPGRGRQLSELIHGEDLPRVRRIFEELLETPGGEVRVEFRVRHEDGRFAQLSGVLTNLVDDESVGGVLLAAQDVTERAIAEEALGMTRSALVDSRERLTRAEMMEAVGRLAGSVAHDFNNFLLAIQGNAELLSGAGLSAEDRVAVDEILSVCERARSLSGQLLGLSRRPTARPKVVSLAESLGELERMLERLLDGVALTLRPVPEDLAVRIDRGQLGQVVMNLVVNARDALRDGEEGGTIEIGARSMESRKGREEALRGLPEGRYVALTVTDDGPGIPPGVRDRIFEPLFTTKPEGKGTGLGLATVVDVVQRAGGAVSLDSELGVGTTFTVYLPQASVAAPPRERERQPEAIPTGVPARAGEGPTGVVGSPAAKRGGRKPLVVLADDDPSIRRLIGRQLVDGGYDVVTVGSGDATLRLVEREPVALVVADQHMPGPAGEELSRAVRALRPGVEVVVMSGVSSDSSTRHFLAKPFDSGTLLRVVGEVLAAS